MGSWFGQRFPSFAWGTLVVNVSGSFVLGLLFALLIERASRLAHDAPGAHHGAARRLHDVLHVLARDDADVRGGCHRFRFANIGLSLVLGLGAVWLGSRSDGRSYEI